MPIPSDFLPEPVQFGEMPDLPGGDFEEAGNVCGGVDIHHEILV
jgi:hypothetical protein